MAVVGRRLVALPSRSGRRARPPLRPYRAPGSLRPARSLYAALGPSWWTPFPTAFLSPLKPILASWNVSALGPLGQPFLSPRPHVLALRSIAMPARERRLEALEPRVVPPIDEPSFLGALLVVSSLAVLACVVSPALVLSLLVFGPTSVSTFAAVGPPVLFLFLPCVVPLVSGLLHALLPLPGQQFLPRVHAAPPLVGSL